ncbi:MAG: hypothetical protein Q8P21_01235 [bacterium]|nr:hypothetical protein [bacterium]
MRFFALALLALSAMGCATKIVQLPDGTIVKRRGMMPQVGVIVTIKNNCSPMMAIESIHGPEVSNLAYGKSATLPIPTRAFSGDSREIWVMISAYTASSVYIGSAVLRERVSIRQGTRDGVVWQVDQLDSPPNVTCPSP